MGLACKIIRYNPFWHIYMTWQTTNYWTTCFVYCPAMTLLPLKPQAPDLRLSAKCHTHLLLALNLACIPGLTLTCMWGSVHIKLNLIFSCQSVSCRFDYSTSQNNQRRKGGNIPFLHTSKTVYVYTQRISCQDTKDYKEKNILLTFQNNGLL